jgi:hypothetical protein
MIATPSSPQLAVPQTDGFCVPRLKTEITSPMHSQGRMQNGSRI